MFIYWSLFLSDEDDWNELIIVCSSLADKWQQLSGFLGLSIRTIKGIRESYPDDNIASLNEALSNWILKEFKVQRHGLPSWKTLLSAIARIDFTLFEKLASEHSLRGMCIIIYFNKAQSMCSSKLYCSCHI